LSKPTDPGASGDKKFENSKLVDENFETPERRGGTAGKLNTSGTNIFAGLEKEKKETSEKPATSSTEEKKADKPSFNLFGGTAPKQDSTEQAKDQTKEANSTSTEKPAINNLFGTPSKQDEKSKSGLFGSATEPKETSSAGGRLSQLDQNFRLIRPIADPI
jgi:hypothetical protein